MFEACRINTRTVERVVVASSDKAYGEHDKLPYTEESPLQGRFPYDVSKSCADLLALCYFHSYGTPIAITRCGNLFGGGDLNFNRLIPGTIRSLLRGEAPVVRSDGTYVRDYFYVRDAVEAYLLLAERLAADDVLGQAFNFGTETPMSVMQMVDAIVKTIGTPHLTPVVLNQASREIPRQYLDASKARRLLQWRPMHTLEQGLLETISWYRQHLES